VPPGLHCPMKLRLTLALVGSAAALGAAPVSFSGGPSRVALIELYTSEGCSSCPPADRWLGALRDDPGLWKEFVPLAFHVNYWDSLGWKDRLSSGSFTEREYAYASAWGSRTVYTPCFVRNGAEWKPSWGLPGRQGGAAGLLRITLGDDGACGVLFEPATGALSAPHEVHLALLGGGIASRVTAGENRGETLTHEFVVLGMTEAALVSGPEGSGERTILMLPRAAADSRRRALAAWITRQGELEPLQAAGGWIP